ncbi:MAG TPA: hypothetical protein VER11_23215 [Polyangiaceae bacterium]|nr:hypothetical protein [Polyangiaceae bacterium]
MSPLLGPILAQLVTLGVSDRSEARYIAAADSYAEVATYPRVGLDFGWKHTTLTLSYGPSITVSPIESEDPYVLVYHSGVVSMSQRWKRTTFTLTESGSYGRVNLRAQALGDPTVAVPGAPVATPAPGTAPPPVTGGAQPGTGGSAMPPATGNNALPSLALNRPLTFVSSTTAFNITENISAIFSLSGGVSYFISGTTDADPTLAYPTVRGPGAQIAGTYRLTHDDGVTTSVFAQFANTSNGNRAWLITANETWAHRFSRYTSGNLGAGLSLTRNSQPNGYEFYSLYPNFVVGITSGSRLGHTVLSYGAGANSSPFIDPFRGLVDPRVSTNAFAGLSKDKFSSSLTAGTGLQLVAGSQSNRGLNTITGAFTVSYRLGDAVSLDSGVRAAWQAFRGTTTYPISIAAFAGVSIALAVPLHGRY